MLLTQRIGPLGNRRSTVRCANGGDRTNLVFGTLDTIDVFVEINELSGIETSHAVTWHTTRHISISPYSNQVRKRRTNEMDVCNGTRSDVEQPYDFLVQPLGPFFDASSPRHLRTNDFATEGRQSFCNSSKVCERSEFLESQKTVTKDNCAFGNSYENNLASRGDSRIKCPTSHLQCCVVIARRIESR